ncbi:MAG: hypothetical protein MJ188_00210 [Treponema sp.]|nr:hypothetical protein [Treponema sp.]
MIKTFYKIIRFSFFGLLFGLCFFGCKKSKTVNIAFYSADEKVENTLKNMLEDNFLEDDTAINFFTLSSNDVLDETFVKKNKIDLVFTAAGNSLKNALLLADESYGVSEDLTSEMFGSMKEASYIKNNKAIALPLCIDHLEVCIDSQAFMDSEIPAINTWKDVENFCRLQKKEIDFPIAFESQDSVFFIDMIGALGEALCGYDAYTKAVDILAGNDFSGENFNANKITEQLFWTENAPFAQVYVFLRNMYGEKLINPSVREFSSYDVDFLIQERKARVVLTSLSKHRGYNTKGISRFSTIYVPSTFLPVQRHFTANATYVLPTSNNSKNPLLIEKLLSPDAQGDFSRKTGLSPVLSNCRTPDKQSSDVRYWIAATNAPLAGLGHEANLSVKQLDILRDEILGMF